MPTTYAHDLFGQKVYRQLPDQVKEIIRKNGELYRIGLHGPDIFFYYFIFKNHVSSVGYRMHKEKARAFFTQGMAQVRETGDEALLAYYNHEVTLHERILVEVTKKMIYQTVLD